MTTTGGKVRISDHAVIRFLEREHGFNFELVRQRMMSAALEQAAEFGASTVITPLGRMVLHGHTVVTFLPTKKMDRKRRRHG